MLLCLYCISHIFIEIVQISDASDLSFVSTVKMSDISNKNFSIPVTRLLHVQRILDQSNRQVPAYEMVREYTVIFTSILQS